MQEYSVVQTGSARPIRLSRAEQQAATRESLLRGAETVFARLGYGGASIELIAAEAGYSKGAVFSNFASKEALFLELLRVYMDRDLAELEKIVSLAPAQLFDALSNWLQTMHADAHCPQLVVELQLHARRSPEFAGKYYALQERHTRTLAMILETYFKAHSKAIPIDAMDLASCLTALAHGISLQNPVGKPGTSDEAGRIIDELLGVFIQR
jgi:AcrR family transcriptional regulator